MNAYRNSPREICSRSGKSSVESNYAKLSSRSRRSLTSVWMILRIISSAIASLTGGNNYFSVHTRGVCCRAANVPLITVGNTPNMLIGRAYRSFRARFQCLSGKFAATFSIENMSAYRVIWKRIKWIRGYSGCFSNEGKTFRNVVITALEDYVVCRSFILRLFGYFVLKITLSTINYVICE